MAPDTPSPGLRASDADREATVTRLHRAATEGRLDPDELDERLTAAYAAKHCTELEALTADVTPPRQPVPWGAPVSVAPVRRPNGLAIASLVCALAWAGFVGSVAAVVLGHAALRQIAESGGRQGGRSLAVAGLVVGYLSIGVAALMLIFSVTW
jgi:hypothetical protein